MQSPLDKIPDSENQPLYKIVYKRLRDAILEGQLPPGTKLIEQSISKKMHISKTPVREAIRELAQEGLISVRTRCGITVIDFNENDVKELVTLRTTLEVLGIRLARPFWTEKDTDILRKILTSIIEAEKTYNYSILPKLDVQFHQHIIERTRNKRLLKAWNDIASQMIVLFRMIRYFEFTEGYISESHQGLIDAIIMMDDDKCEKAFTEHIQSNEKNILASFANHGQKKI